MTVTIEDWQGRPREVELYEALRPDTHGESGGIAEQARAQASVNADAIGKLAALLVEKKVLTLEEAVIACDSWVKVS